MGANLGVRWTAERDAALRVAWAADTPAAQIAADLGGFEHTVDGGKGAVLGRARRLKLAPRMAGQRRLDPDEAERRRSEHNRARSQRRRRRKGVIVGPGDRLREINEHNVAVGLPMASTTSPAYRNQLPLIGNPSKAELRAMIAQAMKNTAEMSV